MLTRGLPKFQRKCPDLGRRFRFGGGVRPCGETRRWLTWAPPGTGNRPGRERAVLGVVMARRQISPKVSVSVVYVLAVFMAIMDITIVNVALPTLGRDFHVPPTNVDVVVTAFLVSLVHGDWKERHLRRDPRASLMIAEEASYPGRAVEASGTASVAPDPGAAAIRRIAIRYLGEEIGERWVSGLASHQWDLMRLEPDRMRSLDHRNVPATALDDIKAIIDVSPDGVRDGLGGPADVAGPGGLVTDITLRELAGVFLAIPG